MQLHMLYKAKKIFINVTYVTVKFVLIKIFNMDLYLPIKFFINVSFIKLFKKSKSLG